MNFILLFLFLFLLACLAKASKQRRVPDSFFSLLAQVPGLLTHKARRCVALSHFLVCHPVAVPAADFHVTTPSAAFAFQINSMHVPNLTLVRGQTYTFDVATSNIHPFHIESSGVVNNDINEGLMTYTVPADNANYYYECVVHGAQMRGEIFTIKPPRIVLLDLALGTNLVLTSTATNDNWIVFPEYTTNLMGTNWFALTVQTNRVVNGALETICGRPEGETVFVRIRSSR